MSADASEIRQNKISKRWVIFAPARGKRPKDFVRQARNGEDLPEYEPSCPFCPGNERLLTPILTELPHPGGSGWQIRVVPNKYPALTPEGDGKRYEEGMYMAMKGFGRHEVFIEHQRHNHRLSSMTIGEVGNVIEAYYRRYLDISSYDDNMVVVIFRNHGPTAGTSLLHPHSQLITTGWTPQYVHVREIQAKSYYHEWGSCVFCDILENEISDAGRIVTENDSFCSFVPFAADVPFELTIMPRRHQASFGSITESEKEDLASILHRALATLDTKLNNPDYNYIINTSPACKQRERHLHWHLKIFPRLTTRAGFEIGSGISINPSLPESDARFLRGEEEASGAS